MNDTESWLMIVGTETELFVCIDCGAEYSIDTDERQFYSNRAEKFPVRCLDCRARKRANRNAELIRNLENHYARGDWNEHLGHFGGSSLSTRNDRRKSGGHATICSACGAETTVPFIPRRGKPVYCTRCFAQRKRK